MLVTAFLSDFETKVTGDLVMSPLLGPPPCSPNLLTQAPLFHQILNNQRPTSLRGSRWPLGQKIDTSTNIN